MTPCQFKLNERVSIGPHTGTVIAVMGPYSVAIRLDATGQPLITSTTGMELYDVPRATTRDT